MRKAYSYLRFSTPEQAKGDSHRRQSELARVYASRNDLDLDDTLTFHDLGVSAFRGANAETGKLGQFKAAVEQGLVAPGSVLLVESLDRISRQAARRALRVLEDVVDAGVSVVTLADNREYDREALDRDPGALLMALLIFIRANEESEMKSRRLKASWAGRRAKAAEKPITSRGPAWHKLGEDRAWRVIEERAEVVRRIFTLAASGVGENAIATALNRDGVATWGDNGRAPAVMWHKSYVSKVLTSRAVIGTLVPFTMVHEAGKKTREAATPVEGYYPAVVPPELWGAVRAIKATASPLRGRHATAPVQNVLGGLARCSLCGEAMTRVYKGTAAKAGAPKLVCTGAKTGTGCAYLPMPLDAVEDALRSGFASLAHSGPNEALEEASQGAIAEIQTRVDEIEATVAGLFEHGRARHADAWKVMDKLLAEKAEAVEHIGRLRELWRYMGSGAPVKHLDELKAALCSDPFDRTTINSTLRRMFSRATVDPRASTLAFEWKSGGIATIMVEQVPAQTRQAAHSSRFRRTSTGRYLSLVEEPAA